MTLNCRRITLWLSIITGMCVMALLLYSTTSTPVEVEQEYEFQYTPEASITITIDGYMWPNIHSPTHPIEIIENPYVSGERKKK